jgi:predicted phage baseplate assembly protein
VEDGRWTEVEDFVGSTPSDTHFCTARDNAGYITVRFGDGLAGRRPPVNAAIRVLYRVGIGEAGRVAADTLTQFSDATGRIKAVANPFAAVDPGEPESIAQARLLGPRRLEIQERAVVESDYEAIAMAGVEAGGTRIVPIQAKARFRWTGSWTTVFVSLDLPGRVPLAKTPGIRAAFESALSEKKLAGLDVRVEDARYAPLHISLRVEVAPGFFARDVRRAVEAALVGAPGERALPFVGAGRFRFGQPVYLSDLYAVVAGVPGVLAVSVTRFKRFGGRHPDSEAQGFIPIGRLEVVRCDNDASHPEHGLVYVRTCGGRDG